MPPRLTRPLKYMQLRLPPELHAAIIAAAREDGRSASSWVIRQIERQLHHSGKLPWDGKS